MKDYNEISDFEINKEVFFKAGIDYEDYDANPFPEDCSSFSYGDGSNWHEFDPCNNPSDMWPLIVESKISILPWNEQMWQAWFTDSGLEGIKHRVFDKNPLRAAAIVYLIIKDEK